MADALNSKTKKSDLRSLASSIQESQRAERHLTILLVSTAVVLAFIGTTIGALTLAHISSMAVNQGIGLFPSHPYLQIYGFITEFVIGVSYSLLPRFKIRHFPALALGYIAYGLITTANVLYLLSTSFGAAGELLLSLGSLLSLLASVVFAFQILLLASHPSGGFPETNPLIMLSSISLVLMSLAFFLEQERIIKAQDIFSPEFVFLALIGFAGSMIYSVEIRSVSFRQSNYRKRFARLGSLLQIPAVASAFLSIIFPVWMLSVVSGTLFLLAALTVLLSIRILEFAHPMMYRPAMMKMHFAIMRYNEVCILSGSAWLLLGCVLGIAWIGTGANTFLLKDASIHSLALGFIGSTITCFAPMLLPGLLGRKAPVTGLTFGPIFMLNAGVLLRVSGDLVTWNQVSLPVWESVSGPLILGAMIWLLIMLREVGKSPSKAVNEKQRIAIDNIGEGKLTFIGRKSRKEMTLTVWFVAREGVIYLLPMKGSSTKWLQNVIVNPDVTLKIGDRTFSGKATNTTESDRVKSTIDLFKKKYGERNYEIFYSSRVDCVICMAIHKESM